MSVFSWISGKLTNLEHFWANVLYPDIKALLGTVAANLHTEFVSAENTFMEAEYAAFKSIIHDTIARVKAANPSAHLFDLVSLVAKEALPALESGGLAIAESAILQFIVAAL